MGARIYVMRRFATDRAFLGLVRAQRQRLLVGLTGRGLGETSATGIAGPGPEPHCGALTLVVWSQAAGREDPPAAGRRRSLRLSASVAQSPPGPTRRVTRARARTCPASWRGGAGSPRFPLFSLESTFQDPCPALNGTRRVTMSRVLTRRREPIARLAKRGHLSVPTNLKNWLW